MVYGSITHLIRRGRVLPQEQAQVGKTHHTVRDDFYKEIFDW